MLKFAWIGNNKKYEIQSYEGIAYCYYYLDELSKSLFYSDRFSTAQTGTLNYY